MNRLLKLSFAAISAAAIISLATVGSTPAPAQIAQGLVALQSTSPGAAQAGNTNITGTSRATTFVGGTATLNSTSVTSSIHGINSGSTLYSSAVWGEATSTGVANYGGFFSSAGANGSGCVGVSTLTSGYSNGGFFRSSAPEGNGVTGWASATTGNAWGGNFASDSTSGIGVYGEATATSGTAYGGKFVNNSPFGSAVYGISPITGGGATGGYFESPTWAGVYGKSVNGPGVIGQSDTYTGGLFFGPVGVEGSGSIGVSGVSIQASGTGVYGRATTTTGAGFGVKGVSESSTGWAGHFSGGKGLFATTLQVNTRTTTNDFTMTTGGADNTVLLGAAGGVASWGTVGNTRLTNDSASLAKVTGGNFSIVGTALQGVDQNMIQLFSGTTEKIRLNPNAPTSGGAISTFGPNGNANTRASFIIGTPDHGYFGVFDSAGAAQVEVLVNASGLGVLTADTKNFKVPDPDDPRYDILYACVEGPEAAMYTRGTARMVDGQGGIDLPEHFLKLANMGTLTVQLTPRDDCQGLYYKLINGQIVVRELQRGTSTIEFDWEVKAIRKGHEDYQVVRPWDDALPDGDKKQMWEARLRSIESHRAKANRSSRP